MMKRSIVVLVLGVLTSQALAQTSAPNAQTQQQILEELRAIHHDMQAGTSLQLLLAELQITQTSLDRATQRRDALKAQVTELQAEKTIARAEVDRFGSGMEKVSKPDQQFVDRFQETEGRADETYGARSCSLRTAANRRKPSENGRSRTEKMSTANSAT